MAGNGRQDKVGHGINYCTKGTGERNIRKCSLKFLCKILCDKRIKEKHAKHVYNENVVNIRKTTKYANIPFFIGHAHPKNREKCRFFFFFAGFLGPFSGPVKKIFSGANRCPTNHSLAAQKNNSKKNLAV